MTENIGNVIISRSVRSGTSNKEFKFSFKNPEKGILAEYQRHAYDVFQKQSFPTTIEEAWRRTDLRMMPADSFRMAEENEYQTLPAIPENLLKPLVADQHGGQVTLVPGAAMVNLNEKIKAQGVIFTDLQTCKRDHPEILEKMIGKTINPDEGKFASLVGSFSDTGVVLYVPRGVTVDQPLHSILWGPGNNIAHISHLLVLVDEGASVTFVHESASPDDKTSNSMHAGIVEIQVMQNASLRFVELQSWGKNTWNITHERIRVETNGNLDWIFGAVGSKLTKNFSELDLVGKGAVGRMSGFYFADGSQHLDHDTQQNHLAPDTKSDLLFKGALKGKSRSVWQGMIYVAPGAQKTDGYQANRNLVLSEHARADSIPGLEILADDVRCTHGATVGKLEQEPLFYLKSRGIPQRDAERLVVEGFFDPIMQRIPFEGVRERFMNSILEKMEA